MLKKKYLKFKIDIVFISFRPKNVLINDEKYEMNITWN